MLFFSILLYSLANFLNGYIVSVEQYKWCRFIAGIGLAGELGAGITIVSEIMSKQKRGYGTMIISSVGMLGAVFAAIIGLNLPWQTAYKIGGILGFRLLALRCLLVRCGKLSCFGDTSSSSSEENSSSDSVWWSASRRSPSPARGLRLGDSEALRGDLRTGKAGALPGTSSSPIPSPLLAL